MTLTELKRIIRLLGRNGAIAGLQASDVTVKELHDLVHKSKLIAIHGRQTRDEMILEIINALMRSNIKPTDELLRMPYDELVNYFSEISPSTDDLMRIMKELNYKVSAEDKKNLRRFVARQISETALFSSVASRGRGDADE